MVRVDAESLCMLMRSDRIVSIAGEFDGCEVGDVLNDGGLPIRPFRARHLAEQDICLATPAKPY